MPGRWWSSKEVDFLRAAYREGLPVDEIVRWLNRSYAAVVNKAHRLELIYLGDWTPEEIDVLRAGYTTNMLIETLADVLGRSVDSVIGKARGLNLSRRCINCGVEICPAATRCLPCSSRAKAEDPEFCRKLSESTTRLWKDPRFRHKVRQAIARAAQDRVIDPSQGRRHSEAMKMAWARGAYDGIFHSPTQPEREIMGALEIVGIEYEFQYRPEGYSRVYDFYVARANLLIEYDGWFWHHSNWAKKKGIPERDAEKTKWAEEHGFRLVRIHEKEMNRLGGWAIVIRRVRPLLLSL